MLYHQISNYKKKIPHLRISRSGVRVPFGVPLKKPETLRFQAFFLLFDRIWNRRILTLEHFRNRNIHWNTLDHIVQTLISSWNGRFFIPSAPEIDFPFSPFPRLVWHTKGIGQVHVTFLLFSKAWPFSWISTILISKKHCAATVFLLPGTNSDG